MVINNEQGREHEESAKISPKTQSIKDNPDYQTREYYRRKAFILMLQLMFIIAIPAFVAAYLGKKMDVAYQSEKTFSLIFSATAFIFSWIIIIIKYNKYMKKVKEAESLITAKKRDIEKIKL